MQLSLDKFPFSKPSPIRIVVGENIGFKDGKNGHIEGQLRNERSSFRTTGDTGLAAMLVRLCTFPFSNPSPIREVFCQKVPLHTCTQTGNPEGFFSRSAAKGDACARTHIPDKLHPYTFFFLFFNKNQKLDEPTLSSTLFSSPDQAFARFGLRRDEKRLCCTSE